MGAEIDVGNSTIENHTSLTASGSTLTIDLAASEALYSNNDRQHTTFAFSNIDTGRSGNIVIKEDGTGGHSFTLPSEAKTPLNGAAITQQTGANKVSVLSYRVRLKQCFSKLHWRLCLMLDFINGIYQYQANTSTSRNTTQSTTNSTTRSTTVSTSSTVDSTANTTVSTTASTSASTTTTFNTTFSTSYTTTYSTSFSTSYSTALPTTRQPSSGWYGPNSTYQWTTWVGNGTVTWGGVCYFWPCYLWWHTQQSYNL